MIASVKIGPMVYTVTEKPRLIGDNADGHSVWLNGIIKLQAASILVEAEMNADMKAVALLHEAMHGILEGAGVIEHPEPVLIALGYGLVALLRENPELVRLIVGDAGTK